MEAKAIESIYLIALTCQTISSYHALIDPSIGGAISIVHGDRYGLRRGRFQWPRRCTSRCLARRLLRREISPRYRTLSTGGAQGPPEASDVRVDDGGGPWPPLPPGGSGDHGLKALDGLWRPKARIARVATYVVPRTIERF